MPSSYPANIPHIVNVMHALDPWSVLDVGVGYGKFGFLFRERIDDFAWERTLDGVEPYEDYINRSGARYLYNNLIHDDWLLEDQIEGVYDLVLMIDVLEHFTHDDGLRALDKAWNHGHHVLISTPIGYEQGPSHGNELETHQSEWPHSAIDMWADRHEAAGINCMLSGTTDTEMYLLYNQDAYYGTNASS